VSGAPDGDAAADRKTLAGWYRLAMESWEPADLPVSECELLVDPVARHTLQPLHSLGLGRARLHHDRITWQGEGREEVFPLAHVRSVTTERNNTLQLGIGQGVMQLLFPTASPWRWQWYVEWLLSEGADSARRGE